MKELDKKYIYFMFVFAYIFSLVVRYLWIYQHSGNPEVLWQGSYIINTNDGYFFASGVQKALFGMHQYNPLVPTIFERGLTFLTLILTKITPFSLETIIFYLPALISSVIVFPIILIGKLYKEPIWGFFSALIATIAWSYYNRTMIGYYDTDMFAIMLLMWVFYYILKSINDKTLHSILITSIFLIIFPFFYQSSRMVIYALLIFYALYILYDSKISDNSLKKLILLFFAATPLPIDSPYNMIFSFLIIIFLYFILKKENLKKEYLIILAIISFFVLLYFGDVFLAIWEKIKTYLHSSSIETKGLKFYGVYQTVAEANGIPFFAQGQANSVANRTIGSGIAFIISVIGYLYLAYKRKEFLIALPLIGIGFFAHWGGLRFTIYGVPLFALGFVYILIILTEYITKDNLQKIVLILIAVVGVLYSNIYHAWEYNRAIMPVFTNSEIKQLNKIKKIANPKDFTLTWWDYGYPIWYYTQTSSLIDGGKHHHDNFIISKMLLSDSSELAYNLAVKSVETYVKASKSYKIWKENGSNEDKIPKEFNFLDTKGMHYHAGNPYSPVINIILRNNQNGQLNPSEDFVNMSSNNYKLPPKTRDIYFYMPNKAIRIFPTIAQFANIDLTTGKPKKDIMFYSSYLRGIKDKKLYFGRGLIFNTRNGKLLIGKREDLISNFIMVTHKTDGDIDIKPYKYNNNTNLSIIYLRSLQMVVLLDNQVLNSNYVKMFLLGIYDKDLFELVDSSPYGRVYKLKR